MRIRTLFVACCLLVGSVATADAHVVNGVLRWLGLGYSDGYHARPASSDQWVGPAMYYGGDSFTPPAEEVLPQARRAR